MTRSPSGQVASKRFQQHILRRTAAALVLAGASMALLPAAGAASRASAADVVLENGIVHTADPANQQAQAVAIKDGKIAYVGTRRGAAALTGPRTKVVDLQGRMVLPGFIDTHNHAYARAEAMFWVNLSEPSLAAYAAATQAFLARHHGARQVRGVGFSLDYVLAQAKATGRSPMQLLDDIVGRDIPAAFITAGHHELWANTKAMHNAGISKLSANPPGGVIDRDPVSGEPTGIVREFGAQSLVTSALPVPDFTVDEFKQAILSFQRELAPPRGVTAVLMPTHYPTDTLLQAMQGLDRDKQLTMRYDMLLWANEQRGTEQVQDLIDRRSKYQGKNFKVNAIKIFGTGASSTYGSVVWDQEVLKNTVAALDKEGFQVYIHDIGPTRTYALMLDAFEYAARQNGVRDARHTITHVNQPAVALIPRFKALGVTADGHPVPAPFFDSGVLVTSSSDYPVRDFHPLERIALGMQRGVALDKLIASHTINGAREMFLERDTGSIEVGKSADLVVLDKNLFALPAADIGKAKVVLTLFQGRPTWRDASFTSARSLQRRASPPAPPLVMGPVTEDPED